MWSGFGVGTRWRPARPTSTSRRCCAARSASPTARVGKQTLANLSALPDAAIDAVEAVLKGKTLLDADAALAVTRSLPHGHVALVAAQAARLSLPQSLGPPCRERDLAYALIVSRVVRPRPKSATLPWWEDVTLGPDLGVAGASRDEVYAAMDWLHARQDAIEAELARRHLRGDDQRGAMAMFDLSSSWVEGSCCPLAGRGYSRDGRKGTLQIEYGLLTDRVGRPVAIRVFPGNTADPAAFIEAVEVVRTKFGIGELTLVGDRGMITSARIEALKELGGLSWITCLRAPAIKTLAAADGPLQMSAVRRPGPGRDHPPRLPRRTADRLPQPSPRAAARGQTRVDAHRHRSPPQQDHYQGAGGETRRRGRDRGRGRQGDRQVQDGQAPDLPDHRHQPDRGRATRPASPPRPPWTASTSSAPACPPPCWTPRPRSAPTRTSRTSNATSDQPDLPSTRTRSRANSSPRLPEPSRWRIRAMWCSTVFAEMNSCSPICL